MAENIFLNPSTQNAINQAVKGQLNNLLYNTNSEFNKTINQASQAALRNMAKQYDNHVKRTSPMMSSWTVRDNVQPYKFVNGNIQNLSGIEAVTKKYKAFNQLMENKGVQELDKAVEQAKQRLRATQQATITTSQKTTEVSQFAKQSSRYEFVQMGLMLANQVTQSITQGFERSAAIAESMYKEMANRAISSGNWGDYLSAKRNELSQIRNQGGSQYFGGLVTGAVNTAMLAKLMGPIGLIGGGIATGFNLFGISQQQSAEKEKIKADIAYRSQQIYSKSGETASNALKTIAEENNLANLKKQLSDTNIKASHFVKMQIVETEKANKSLEEQLANLKNRIDSLKKQSGNEALLLQAEKESADLIQQRAANVAKIKQFKSLDEAYEKQEASKELARLKAEEDARIYEANNLAARNVGKRYFQDVALREAAEKYENFQAMMIEQYGLEKGGSLAFRNEKGKLTDPAEAYTDKIAEVRNRLKDSYNRYNPLKKKLDENVATVDEVKELINLDKEIKADRETLKQAEDLINAAPQMATFKEASKAMVEQMSQQIGSSSFMSDNLGMFNQYFGKTDASLNLISETNSLLKNILTSVENIPKDLCLVTTYQ